MTDLVQLQIEDHVAILTLHRPEALNALNSELLGALENRLIELEKKSFSEVRTLIVTGSGSKAFVAGADIKEMSDLNSSQAQVFAKRGQRIFRKIELLKIPVIAAVNGFALGGGLELALACDFIYASHNAKLGLPETSLGLIPGFGGTVRLSRVIGLAKAKELIYSAGMLTAEEAKDWGLVNRIFSVEDLLPESIKAAKLMASRSPVALREAKKSVQLTFDQDLDQALATEAQLFGELFSSEDTREGTQAFINKRKAQFQGK